MTPSDYGVLLFWICAGAIAALWFYFSAAHNKQENKEAKSTNGVAVCVFAITAIIVLMAALGAAQRGAEMPTVLIIALLLYMTPSWVAAHRWHKNRAAVCALNLFLGWTLVGWVVALVWALTANVETPNHPQRNIDLSA